MILRWLLRLVQGDPVETEALRGYIRSELRLATLQTRAAEEFNSVVARCAGPILSGSADDATKRDMVEGADRYVGALQTILAEHGSITPPPRAAEAFFAHEVLYRSYVAWARAQQLFYGGAPWVAANEIEAVKRSDKALRDAKRAADRQKAALVRAARVSAAEMMEMTRDAGFYGPTDRV